jgi:hypothetical protein
VRILGPRGNEVVRRKHRRIHMGVQTNRRQGPSGRPERRLWRGLFASARSPGGRERLVETAERSCSAGSSAAPSAASGAAACGRWSIDVARQAPTNSAIRSGPVTRFRAIGGAVTRGRSRRRQHQDGPTALHLPTSFLTGGERLDKSSGPRLITAPRLFARPSPVRAGALTATWRSCWRARYRGRSCDDLSVWCEPPNGGVHRPRLTGQACDRSQMVPPRDPRQGHRPLDLPVPRSRSARVGHCHRRPGLAPP